LRKFADSADEIAKGNITASLPKIKTKDEMYRLRNSFETMQLSLVRQIEETKAINAEKGRMEGELQTARSIQMSMLPKTFPPYPDRDDIDIYGQLVPAKEVGGDLFDFYIRDEKLFFCIGDVSGKGVPASLLMAVTRSLFRTVSAHESQPARIMTTINESIAEDNDSNMFITLFIGVLDLPTGRLRYSNAGHDAPLLIGKANTGKLPCDPNLPIGIEANWKFTTQEAVIDPETIIFLFTDGLTEAENIYYDQFQEERIIETIRLSEHTPQQLIQSMTEAVRQFTDQAEQNDDQTMLAIQYTKEQDNNARLCRTITLSNNIDEVPQLAAFVDEICEAIGVDMSTAMSLNLAIEEAVVNCMDYAYPAGTKGNINIEAKANDQRLKFVITDWGTPFDPTAKTEVDTTLPAEERPIGGLGIHLVRQIMDSINYERTDGKNVLTLRKKLV
jgi:sigma-B regulation protein RsbU (phosphoserine phosphatase)